MNGYRFVALVVMGLATKKRVVGSRNNKRFGFLNKGHLRWPLEQDLKASSEWITVQTKEKRASLVEESMSSSEGLVSVEQQEMVREGTTNGEPAPCEGDKVVTIGKITPIVTSNG